MWGLVTISRHGHARGDPHLGLDRSSPFRRKGFLATTSSGEGQLRDASDRWRRREKACKPVVRYTVADTATWAQPAISGDGIFIKDVSALTLWSVH
jgi:hypothetical protein